MEASINFALRGVSVEQFATIFVPTSDNIQLDLNVPIHTNYDDRAIAVGAKVQYLDNNQIFLIAEVLCHFVIKEESWSELTVTETRDAIIPKSLINNFVRIAIGTLRGALCVKAENTPYSKYFLPLINMADDYGEDLVISAK